MEGPDGGFNFKHKDGGDKGEDRDGFDAKVSLKHLTSIQLEAALRSLSGAVPETAGKYSISISCNGIEDADAAESIFDNLMSSFGQETIKASMDKMIEGRGAARRAAEPRPEETLEPSIGA